MLRVGAEYLTGMHRWVPYVAAFALAMLTTGCTEDEICAAGVCGTDPECLEICEEFCEGEVIAAFCGFEDICNCECEFDCLL